MKLTVTCTTKNSFDLFNYQIHALGGQHVDGSPWITPLGDAIERIESGKQLYCVDTGAGTLDLSVAVDKGIKFLKTSLDLTLPLVLFALPDCCEIKSAGEATA